MRQLVYINVIDDVNKENIAEIEEIYNKSSLVIRDKFELPKEGDIKALFGDCKQIDFNRESIVYQLRNILYGTSNEACEIIVSNMEQELDALAPNGSLTVKINAYIKTVYWLKRYFIGLLDKPSQIVIYNAPMGKYEMYTLYLLSKLGINIVIITKDISKLRLDLYPNILLKEYHTNEDISLTGKSKVLKSLQELKEYISTKGIPTLKVVGCNDNAVVELNNFLVWLDKEIDKQTIKLFKHELPKPTTDEVRSIQKPSVTNTIGIVYTTVSNLNKCKNTKKVQDSICNELIEYFKNETNTTKIFSRCVTIICWANNILLNTPELPKALIVYGKVDKTSEQFINIAIALGIKVLIICTDKKNIGLADLQSLDLGNSLDLFKYPTSEIREKQATIAYNASQEINSLLYNGETLGLYRDRQFKTCKTSVLNTTYEEVAIYWHQETKFRPHFEVRDNTVHIPNFFIKVSGCLDDYSRYLDEIARLVNDNTIVYYNTGFIDISNPKMFINHGASVNGIPFNEQKKMIDKHIINPEIIMSYKNYNYGFLSEEVQLHMISKIQELIDGSYIKVRGLSDERYEDIILNVCLNLDTETLRLIQWFDFTKLSPKVVVISQTEKIVTLEDTIYLAYLSLLGFDIAVIVPTAYNSIEKFLSDNMYQEHTIGQPKFNTNITNLKVQAEPAIKGWFSKIFKN